MEISPNGIHVKEMERWMDENKGEEGGHCPRPGEREGDMGTFALASEFTLTNTFIFYSPNPLLKKGICGVLGWKMGKVWD